MRRLDLRKFRKKNFKNMTQKEFAESIGIKQPHLSDLERFKDNIADKLLQTIYNVYGEENLKPYWRDDYPLNEDDSSVNERERYYEKGKPISIINREKYGMFLQNINNDIFIKDLPTLPYKIEPEYFDENYLVFEVNDDSMESNSKESLKPGDRLLCREVKKKFWEDKLELDRTRKYVLIIREERIIFRYITNKRGEMISVTALNPLIEDAKISVYDITRIYLVLEFTRTQ